MKRTPFPKLFWVGNGIEVIERLAYYGLYMGFQVYATTTLASGGLGWDKDTLGVSQTLFLGLSYSIPLIAGILADRYGFKRMLMLSYLLYLPGFLLLLVAKQYYLVLLVLSLIGVAAGVFKPLIVGTVRLTSDETNQTLGFGIFYQMVNIGAFLGPMVAGALRTISWNYAFMMSAGAVVLMMTITGLFYKNPAVQEAAAAQESKPSLLEHIKEIIPFLKNPKILIFILLFGVFIEIPFWAFFNVVAMYSDTYVAMDQLYVMFSSVLGETIVGWVSTKGEDGVYRIAGETMSHTALWIIIFQLLVTRTCKRIRDMSTLAIGIITMVAGCVILYYAVGDLPALLFLGSLLFAVGEMACMPRFEQYLICLLPPEKTGLGGGLLRIPVVIGALSGITFTPLYGMFEERGTPQTIWFVIGGTLLVGFFGVLLYDLWLRRQK